jgi:Arc/MetJ-type ribon-helix-helix transcriptional regulator
MAAMVRKQVYIEPRQDELLKQAAVETGMTESEIVRQAIDLWEETEAKKRRAEEAWEEAQVFIEELIARGPVPGGRTWKREELYDRCGG